ncbi:Ig-like domain-containing protein [Brevibacillus sp. 179-C 1.1 NHS]|uniref:Ig-like domain-containing protein n=1 Tax=Brevibacillus sp. 179-C 1.1 NHS TaxID=3235177 RepID=UPI0039A29B42
MKVQSGKVWTFLVSRSFWLLYRVGMLWILWVGFMLSAGALSVSANQIGPDLEITKSHQGDFIAGKSGDYWLSVENVGSADTIGVVSVQDTVPNGMQVTSISGNGWTCDVVTVSCTRSNYLPVGAMYPYITVTVLVAEDIQGTVINTASVTVYGDVNLKNNTASDPTTIVVPPIKLELPQSNMYREGDILNFAVSYAENVTVSGTPTLPLVIGSTPVNANFVSGSGTKKLFFAYLIGKDLEDYDGISVGASMELNGGSITDSSNQPAPITFGTVSGTGINVDSKIPALTSVEVPQPGIYGVGDKLSFKLKYSEPVNVNLMNKVHLELIVGTQPKKAMYESGSGSNTLVFTYSVQPGDRDLDGITLRPEIVLDGGTIQDYASHPTSLELANIGSTSGITVATSSLKITAVSVPSAGLYGENQKLDFTVKTSEPVTVNTGTGTPAIELIIGSEVKKAQYISGSGTNELVFRYVLRNGDEDQDGISIHRNEILLNGGTIQNSAGNALPLALEGIADTSGIMVDANPPAIPVLDPLPFIQKTNQVTVSGSAEPNSIITIVVDNTPEGTATPDGNGKWSTTVTLENGIHQIKARATDRAGNSSGDSMTVTFTVDGTAPPKPVITLSNNQWTNQDVDVTLTGEGRATIEYKLNEGGWIPYTTTFTITDEGITTIRAKQTDPANNSSEEEMAEVRIDRTKPEITLKGESTVRLYVGTSFQDPGATVSDLTPGLTANVSGSVDTNKAGTYTLRYDAIDPAGNQANPVIRTIHVVERPITPPPPPVVYPVTGISLDEEKLMLEVGEEVTLKATISPSFATNQEVKWKSSNPKVAEVDDKGRVTAKREGKTTITVITVDGKKEATSEVVVIEETGASFRLETSDKKLWMKPYSSVRFKVYAVIDGKRKDITKDKETSYDSDNDLITWKSGRIQAGKTEGEAVLTVRYHGEELEIPVTISKQSVRSLSANIQNAVLELDEERELEVTAILSNKKSEEVTEFVQWSSSQSQVADVTKDGVLLAKKAGTTVIKGKYANKEVRLSIFVMEEKVVDRLETNRSSFYLKPEESKAVTVHAVYGKGFKEEVTSDAEWTSDDPEIATVDEDGNITAIAEGSTIITVSYKGKDIQIKVVVSK